MRAPARVASSSRRYHSAELRALALDGAAESAERSLRIYRQFQDTLRAWLDDPVIRAAHSAEALAWARFSYGEESEEELRYKTETLRRLGKVATLQYCLDGMFHLLIGINFGRALHARLRGTADRVPLPTFQALLREVPALFDAWVAALHLAGDRGAAESTDALVWEPLRGAEQAVERGR
jgi:hypothetical protein